jgi:uncharacterized protein (DUF2252 family)
MRLSKERRSRTGASPRDGAAAVNNPMAMRRPPARFDREADRIAFGKARRERASRVGQAVWKVGPRRADPCETLTRSFEGRLIELLPIKEARMCASPFGFFRGAVPVMAADLASLRRSGVEVQLCGDAHVRNLGAYAAPDGHLLFDINDFDETIRGPFEWDLKRLATSVVLAGREAGARDADSGDAVEVLLSSYRSWMNRFREMSPLELFRFQIRRFRGTTAVEKVLGKAERETPERTLAKLTVPAGRFRRRFAQRPPLLVRLAPALARRVMASLGRYRATLSDDRQLLLDAYRPVDAAFKVVGTGSVGARDYVVKLVGTDTAEPLFLQIKQEFASAYAPFLKRAARGTHQGQRVAQAQHRMQTLSDSFLGWAEISGRHFLVRQLSDHKAAIEPGALRGSALAEYARLAGELFAKAHARTGDPAVICGYCGDSEKLDRAIRRFAVAYADQTTKDFTSFRTKLRLRRRSRR